ncbi:MAG TPA: transglutaminase-like cysteine peptidase, partial [Caulobacteraceae bacterium]|nr:transglutaminase-like cysteine peptidase [Caulobacteraceae bacterium]
PASIVREADAGLTPMAPAVLRRIQPAAPLDSSPNLFGTVALAVAHTSEDAQWRRVSASRLPATGGPWTGVLQRARGLSEVGQLRLVNAWVNGAVAPASDVETYGVMDYWATAAETLTSGRGDCEDYAIAKMQMLQTLGFRSDDLYLVIVRDLVRRADHALLAVRADGRWWILDSAGRDIAPAETTQDYRPIMTFSAGREWLHGYRRQAPTTSPVIMASADVPRMSALAAIEARQSGQ